MDLPRRFRGTYKHTFVTQHIAAPSLFIPVLLPLVSLPGDSTAGSCCPEFIARSGSYSHGWLHQDPTSLYHGHARDDSQGALPRSASIHTASCLKLLLASFFGERMPSIVHFAYSIFFKDTILTRQ